MIFYRLTAFALASILLFTACSQSSKPASTAGPLANNDGQQAVSDADNPSAAEKPKVRQFRFIYAGVADKLTPGKKARIWLPVAKSNYEQAVRLVKINLPTEHRETAEKKHGNRMLYFEVEVGESGQIPFSVEYLVERRELLETDAEDAKDDLQQMYLTAAALVPTDHQLLAEILPGTKPQGKPVEVAKQLYDAVDYRMRYDKPKNLPWGRGDSVWACESGVGNCTDFHSLFISVCRETNIPARFEIGFPIPDKRGEGEVAGYHCWAKFVGGGRWIPVDISEADKHPELKKYYFGNLTENRVTFTMGRDLQLEPPQEAGPVNFLVYPYIEVDGKQHTSFVKKFRYEDVE